jgi:RND family efflux transporter MFP subunit
MPTVELPGQKNAGRILLAALSVVGLSVSIGAAEEGSLARNEFNAHSAPVEKREQNFDVPGVVDKVLVKEGDVVKAGQLIAQQDTDVDEAHLRSAELLAKSDLEIKAEEATLKKDQIDLDRKVILHRTGDISPSDYDEAVTLVQIDQLKGDHAREDKEKASYDVLESKGKIKLKRMYARIDGVVSQIATHEGELADTQHPAITIVKNDVLYVEVDLPADVVNRLKASGMKAPLQVRYKDEGEKGVWRDAAIHFIKPEADAQSNYEHVQLQMPNPEMRSAGLQVVVKLPDNLIAPPAGGTAAR